ncbi:MAG: hypothetical protein U1D70_12520 [Methylobacter sp.]|nr:hypothetical protein [Methylobacter sp.]
MLIIRRLFERRSGDQACVAWIKPLLKGVFGLDKMANHGALNFIVIDGSTMQEPGGRGNTAYAI